MNLFMLDGNKHSIHFSPVSLCSLNFPHIPKSMFPPFSSTIFIFRITFFKFCIPFCSYPNSKFHFSIFHVTPNIFHFLNSKFHLPFSLSCFPISKFLTLVICFFVCRYMAFRLNFCNSAIFPTLWGCITEKPCGCCCEVTLT